MPGGYSPEQVDQFGEVVMRRIDESFAHPGEPTFFPSKLAGFARYFCAFFPRFREANGDCLLATGNLSTFARFSGA